LKIIQNDICLVLNHLAFRDGGRFDLN
jgi:hypothetical protein